MNYLTEILAFYGLAQVTPLSPGQIALWHALMYINNKAGWSEWFTAPIISLELNSGLSRSGIKKCRAVLRQIGLIDFKENGANKATSYKMLCLSNSSRSGVHSSACSSVRSSIPLNKQNKNKTKQYSRSENNGKNKGTAPSYDIEQIKHDARFRYLNDSEADGL